MCVTPELQDLFCAAAAAIVFSWCSHDLVEWHRFCRCAQHLIDRKLCAFTSCSMCHLTFWVFLCQVGGDILMQPLCVALKGCVHKLVFNVSTRDENPVFGHIGITRHLKQTVCASLENLQVPACKSSRNRPHRWVQQRPNTPRA